MKSEFVLGLGMKLGFDEENNKFYLMNTRLPAGDK
jgi:hypothetical protein